MEMPEILYSSAMPPENVTAEISETCFTAMGNRSLRKKVGKIEEKRQVAPAFGYGMQSV